MDYFYIRSTGDVVGQKLVGKKVGKHNRKRQLFGNYFTDQKRAERAAKIIKFVLRFL